MSLFNAKSSKVIFFFSKKLQYTKRRKKRRRKREENMKKKTKGKKERKEEKKKRRIRKVERRRKIWEYYLYLVNTIPLLPFHFRPCVYQFYHYSISTNSIYHFLPSSSTSFGRIIKHQWYLSFYIISNLFT